MHIKDIVRLHRRLVWSGAALVIAGLCVFGFFTHTSAGRITGVYVAGGFKAPWGVRTECRHTAQARVHDLFTKPLMMNDEAKNGLREYWHYSFYRECLYRAGYSFMGEILPESTLYAVSADERWYVNTLAGTYLRVPTGTTIVRDNELDVTFNAQLLRSEFSVAGTTLYLDTYTSHQFVKTLTDLPGYLDHFTAGTSTVVRHESATTTGGVPYINVTQDNGMCGLMTVTEDAYVLHLFTACAWYEKARPIFDTLKLIPAVSVH